MATHDPAELEDAFGEVLDDVLGLLARLDIPHMLIGGLAVAVRAEPRATKDIDFLVGVGRDEAQELVAEMARLEFRSIVHGTAGPGAVIRFVRTGDDGIDRWVDVLCAGTPFEQLALARAPRERLLKRTLPVATVEDLVILKLLAGRPQDWADVDVLLREHAGRLDDHYLDATARDWEIEDLLMRARRTATDTST
jgi:hypothetical protein